MIMIKIRGSKDYFFEMKELDGEKKSSEGC